MSPHGFSETCQKEGVKFVMAVNKILNPDSKAAEEFDKTPPLQCYLRQQSEKGTPEEAAHEKTQADPEKEKELRQAMEDKMLCAVMCCCDRSPAKSSKPTLEERPNPDQKKINEKNYHQTCVKDIFDRVNGIRDDNYKRHEHLPNSPYAAELSINEGDYKERGYMLDPHVGRGIMNPKGIKRDTGDRLVRPDMAMLSSNFAKDGAITLDDIERFVEMKFPTEDGDTIETIKQIFEYSEFGRPVHLMQRCKGKNFEKIFNNSLFDFFKIKNEEIEYELVEKIRKIEPKFDESKIDIQSIAQKDHKSEVDLWKMKLDRVKKFMSKANNMNQNTVEKIISEDLQIEIRCCDCIKKQENQTNNEHKQTVEEAKDLFDEAMQKIMALKNQKKAS